MIVSGVPERSKYHAEHVADLALDMISAMPSLVDPSESFPHLKIRIGKKRHIFNRDLVYLMLLSTIVDQVDNFNSVWCSFL